MRNKSMVRALVAGLATVGLIIGTGGASDATTKNISYGRLKAYTAHNLQGVNGFAEVSANTGYRFTGTITATLYQLTSSGPDLRVASCARTLSGVSYGWCSGLAKPVKGKCYYTRAGLKGTMKLASNGVKTADINTSLTDTELKCY
jgi:hypothetical protein